MFTFLAENTLFSKIKKSLFKKSVTGFIASLIIAVPVYAKDLSVSYIDIGQGDSELIELPEGKNILIDAGDKDGTKNLMKYLNSRNIKKLDLVIISHPHLDHYGGLLQVLKSIDITQVYDSGAPTSSSTYLKLLKQFAAKKVKLNVVRKGQDVSFNDGIVLKILAPEDPLLKNTRSDANNASVVAKLIYNKTSFLFTGDIEEESQDRLLKDNASDLKSDVLKVAHHGSRYTSSKEFLETVKPRIAVISCGTGNSYGHPHKEALQRLAAENIKIYRTDLNGTVLITSDGNDIKVSTMKTSEKVAVPATKTNLNSAAAEELELLPGINSNNSKILVGLRPIKSWNQLKKLNLTKEELTQLKTLAVIDAVSSTEPKNTQTTTTIGKVNINTATMAELIALPGIGDKTAQKIISGRPYSSVDDLLKIKGMTKNKMKKFIDLITVN